MKTYIILLRGINVGGKNILPMKELVALFEGAGCQKVRTYIQSGNVVAGCPTKPAKNIPDFIEAKHGFRPEIVVLEKSEFRACIENNPFGPQDGKALHFFFAAESLKPDSKKIGALLSDTEQFEVKGRVFYLYAPDGIGRSKLVKNIDACLGVRTTGRNFNTVTKMLDLAENA